MSARVQLYILVTVLVVLGVGLTAYKSLKLGFPLLPGAVGHNWTVEAKITFDALNEPVEVSMALPESSETIEVLGDDHVSPWYGFTRQPRDGQVRGVWATREARGEQAIYYKVLVSDAFSYQPDDEVREPPEPPEPPVFEGDIAHAAEAFVGLLHRVSADPKSFTGELLHRLNDPASLEAMTAAKALREHYQGAHAVTRMAIDLLALEGIPARFDRGIYLEDGRRGVRMESILEIYDGKRWVYFDSKTGQMGLPKNFLVWQRGGVSLLDVTGGVNSKVTISTIQETLPATMLAVRQAQHTQAALVDFSIYSLPVEVQNIFKLLLLTPLGALVVVIMRNLVGVRTSGTFMPILIALSFRQTELLPGLTIFILIVALGLMVRSYLSRLNLLLVPRISAVVIVVILVMATMSVLSYKLGILAGLKVTFFPIIILSWTVERMSVLWEEDGPREVMIQGFGSLFVASLTYLLMGMRFVQHLTFSFPELLLVILAIILMIGQYNGYRLSELQRFSPMVKE